MNRLQSLCIVLLTMCAGTAFTTAINAQENAPLAMCDNRSTPDVVAAFLPRVVEIEIRKENIRYYYNALNHSFDEVPSEELKWLVNDLEKREGISVPNHQITREFFEELKKNPKLRTEQRDGEKFSTGAGSGTIFDEAGHVLTNNHVIEGADTISVTLFDGRKFDAKLVGTLPKVDIAVIQITDFQKDLTFPPIRTAPVSSLRMGQFIVVLGNALGAGTAMTGGYISRPAQQISGMPPSFRFIRTDASINPGNSGGAAIDGCDPGVMVGIPDFILRDQLGGRGTAKDVVAGWGFLIHAELALTVAKRIAAGLPAGEGWVGIMTSSYDSARDSSIKLIYHIPSEITRGLVVSMVEPNSPASENLKKNDLITSIEANGNVFEPKNSDDLQNLILWMSEGDTITLKGNRFDPATKTSKPIICGDSKESCTIAVGKQTTP